MRALALQPQSMATLDLAGIALAAAPVVLRIVSLLRELQPDIQGWLQAQTKRAQQDASIVSDLHTLCTEMHEANERQQASTETIELALTELLRRTKTND